MGQTLSAPITEKHSSAGHDKRFGYGASAMQGWRISILFLSMSISNVYADDVLSLLRYWSHQCCYGELHLDHICL